MTSSLSRLLTCTRGKSKSLPTGDGHHCLLASLQWGMWHEDQVPCYLSLMKLFSIFRKASQFTWGSVTFSQEGRPGSWHEHLRPWGVMAASGGQGPRVLAVLCGEGSSDYSCKEVRDWIPGQHIKSGQEWTASEERGKGSRVWDRWPPAWPVAALLGELPALSLGPVVPEVQAERPLLFALWLGCAGAQTTAPWEALS